MRAGQSETASGVRGPGASGGAGTLPDRAERRPDPPRAQQEESQTAAALVATLWRAARLGIGVIDRPPLDAEPPDAAVDLPATIRRIATDAEMLVGHAPVAERPAALLLAETARAVHQVLGARLPNRDGAVGGGGALASAACQRLARMEQWLAARATTDPDAAPSADLCLWVLDRLEGDAG